MRPTLMMRAPSPRLTPQAQTVVWTRIGVRLMSETIKQPGCGMVIELQSAARDMLRRKMMRVFRRFPDAVLVRAARKSPQPERAVAGTALNTASNTPSEGEGR